MRKGFLILALGLFAAAGTAAADDLALPEAGAEPPDAPAPVTLPAKGITMAAVQKQFGEPRDKHGPVGGGSPKQPPITRWDYDTFVVIFEKDRVVDAVVPGAPPKLRTTAGLTRATDAPPPPTLAPVAPMETPAEPAPEPEAIIPEAPAEEAPPPAEPTAEAAPMVPEAPAEAPPAEATPTEAPPAEPAAAEPATEPAPEQSPEDAPPTPK